MNDELVRKPAFQAEIRSKVGRPIALTVCEDPWKGGWVAALSSRYSVEGEPHDSGYSTLAVRYDTREEAMETILRLAKQANWLDESFDVMQEFAFEEIAHDRRGQR